MVGREQISDNAVVVAGVERNLVRTTRCRHATDHVQREVAIERRDLDAHDVFNLGEACPEIAGKMPSTDRWLEIESHDGNRVGNRAAVGDKPIIAYIGQRRQRKQADVVTKLVQQVRLGDRLPGGSDDAADADDGLVTFLVFGLHLFESEFQYGSEQADFRSADGELGGVYTNGQPASARCEVVSRDRTLMTFVEFPLFRERERLGRDDDAASQHGHDIRGGMHVTSS